MSERVFVGLSGGVDSSVAAALLQQQGYDVVGVFMKNWSRDIGANHCPWREDLASARSVAAHLGIELRVYDFEQQYFDSVAKYMIETYQKGLTPNPDVMCNAEIKFKVFAERCFSEGADYIATGHYARVGRCAEHSAVSQPQVLARLGDTTPLLRASTAPRIASLHSNLQHICLKRAADANKDQTYFLYRAPAENLARTLFPLGELPKPRVRELAHELGLPTANRPDSQGLCFVGNIPLRSFLGEFIPPKQGDIIDQDGKVIGRHDGAFFYTIGQRHGLGVGGGKPYFVYRIDVVKNELHVTTDPEALEMNTREFTIGDCVWLTQPKEDEMYNVQVRYRTPAKPGRLTKQGHNWRVVLENLERAITPGQSAVIYDDDVVVGGGIIA